MSVVSVSGSITYKCDRCKNLFSFQLSRKDQLTHRYICELCTRERNRKKKDMIITLRIQNVVDEVGTYMKSEFLDELEDHVRGSAAPHYLKKMEVKMIDRETDV